MLGLILQYPEDFVFFSDGNGEPVEILGRGTKCFPASASTLDLPISPPLMWGQRKSLRDSSSQLSSHPFLYLVSACLLVPYMAQGMLITALHFLLSILHLPA